MADAPRVLVVEDDQKIRDIMKWILERAGFRVSTADDGESGAAAAIADPPDAVLLDLMLPKLSGFEVLSRLRDAEGTKDVPVIIVTARAAGEGSLGAARERGAVGYLEKPFKSETLVAVVREILAKA